MSTAIVFPVLWKDAEHSAIAGAIDIAVCDLRLRGLEGSTVHDLILVLNEKFQAVAKSAQLPRVRRVSSILLYGTRMSPDRSLASVIVGLSAYCPRLLATARSCRRRIQSWKIFVQPPSGSALVLDVAADQAISDLKLEIQDRTRIPCAEQLLTFEGKPLQDGRTLLDYNASSESTLRMLLRLRGGYTAKPFADVSDDSLRRVHAFVDNAPRWRKAHKGLNIEGYCETPLCAAYKHLVIHPLGIHPFNLTRDTGVACPICGVMIKPVTCLFHDCAWKYEGVRLSDQCLMSSPWKNALGPLYHRFDVDEMHGIVAWETLLIDVQSSATARAAKLVPGWDRPTTSSGDLCCICWSTAGMKKQLLTTTCGHAAHDACMREWAAWCERGKVLLGCPVCHKGIESEASAMGLA